MNKSGKNVNEMGTGNSDAVVTKQPLNFEVILDGLSMSSENSQLTFIRRLTNTLPNKLLLLLLKSCINVLYKRRKVTSSLLPLVTQHVVNAPIEEA